MPLQAKSLDTYKRDTARLLKAARTGDASAAARLRTLDELPAVPQLKHALAVVAREAGFDGWTALKTASEGGDFSDVFAAPQVKDSVNAWFATYDEGKAHHVGAGGVLLPYRGQVFVTSLNILSRLGFERDDPDWKDIGYDFVRPASPAAHARITAAFRRSFGA